MNNSTGRLEGWGYDPPHPTDVRVKLRSKLLFTIEICMGEALTSCQTGFGTEHPAELTMVRAKFYKKQGTVPNCSKLDFSLTCCLFWLYLFQLSPVGLNSEQI
jgi:hypothetical protein